MRLPLISPADLTPEQRPLYEDMRRGIETNFKGFKAMAASGELVGPWNPWLHFPKFGGPVWELVKAALHFAELAEARARSRDPRDGGTIPLGL